MENSICSAGVWWEAGGWSEKDAAGGSIWISQASGCWQVILSHLLFCLYFLIIRALLILQLKPFFSPFSKAMIFHIVILSFFRLPKVGGWFFLCSDTLQIASHPAPPLNVLWLVETYDVCWVFGPHLLVYNNLLANDIFLVTSMSTFLAHPPSTPCVLNSAGLM